MAADPSTGSVLLYGGWDPCHPDGAVYYTDTWRWDGQRWEALPGGQAPGARYNAAMAYHAPSQRMVLYGGRIGAGAQMAEWNGQEWSTRLDAEDPGAVQAPGLATGPFDGDLVLVGADGQPWRWDGSAWTRSEGENFPSQRVGLGADYDTARSELVVYGGMNGQNYLDDVWYWNGLIWQEDPSMAPTGRAYFGMAFDPIRRQLLIFGGLDANGVLRETWIRF